MNEKILILVVRLLINVYYKLHGHGESSEKVVISSFPAQSVQLYSMNYDVSGYSHRLIDVIQNSLIKTSYYCKMGPYKLLF